MWLVRLMSFPLPCHSMCISPKEEDPTQIETECSLAEYRQENDHLTVSKQALKNICAVLFLKYDFKFHEGSEDYVYWLWTWTDLCDIMHFWGKIINMFQNSTVIFWDVYPGNIGFMWVRELKVFDMDSLPEWDWMRWKNDTLPPPIKPSYILGLVTSAYTTRENLM